MKQRIVIEYDALEKSLKISENDFTALEAFGVLEGAKTMISANWLGDTEEEEIK